MTQSDLEQQENSNRLNTNPMQKELARQVNQVTQLHPGARVYLISVSRSVLD